jgi:transposase
MFNRPGPNTKFLTVPFAGSDKGGERIANILTIIETAKMNGHNPETYLTTVLTLIQDYGSDRLEELLPWNMPIVKTSGESHH